MTAKVVHLVLDTNVFMHFAWADVDWCGLAGADEVVLVVPAVVIGELDRHRKEHRSSAMRDRTRAVISRLRTLRTSTGPAITTRGCRRIGAGWGLRLHEGQYLAPSGR